MAPKHPYTSQAKKAILINNLDQNILITRSAARLGINIKTARGIKRRANKISRDFTPSVSNISTRIQVAKKPSPRHVLSELDINTLDQTIRQDRKHRDMYQFEVAQEIHLPGSRTTI